MEQYASLQSSCLSRHLCKMVLSACSSFSTIGGQKNSSGFLDYVKEVNKNYDHFYFSTKSAPDTCWSPKLGLQPLHWGPASRGSDSWPYCFHVVKGVYIT